MKKLLISTVVLCLAVSAFAQKSPPATAEATVDGVNVKIKYSQPALKGRPFGVGDFHPFGEVWRNGANAATQLIIADDVQINGEKLTKGNYSFYVIPDEKQWTLIFNSNWDQWGTQYDNSTDVLRVKADVVEKDEYTERYTISLGDDGNGSLNWGDFKVAFKVSGT